MAEWVGCYVGRYRKPTIILSSLTMDWMDEFQLRSGASLAVQTFIGIGKILGVWTVVMKRHELGF